MQRYFLDSTSIQGDSVTLPADVAHHIGTVLREGPGYEMVVLDGSGQAYHCEVEVLDKKSGRARVLSQETVTTELPVEVTLAYGLPKGDKVEWVAQKGTELGLHHLWLFESKRSVAKWDAKKAPKKLDRLTKIMQEAAEQSYRGRLPQCDFVTMPTLLSRFEAFDHVIVAYEETAKAGEKSALVATFSALTPGQKVLIIVGPEGGITEEELHRFLDAGARACALGPRILRTETAPLYALAALSYQLELSM